MKIRRFLEGFFVGLIITTALFFIGLGGLTILHILLIIFISLVFGLASLIGSWLKKKQISKEDNRILRENLVFE